MKNLWKVTASELRIWYCFSGGIRMKTLGKDILWGFIMGFLVPGVMLNFAAAVLLSSSGTQPHKHIPSEGKETEPTQFETVSEMVYIPVLVDDGQIMDMELNEYLEGVLLAEMPAYFEMEALKAQSVVARTYTLKSASGGKHPGAAVCTRSACCQAYVDPDEYGGTAEDLQKIQQAVEATSGMVLTYDGELIEATYFSCSGGRTEDAAAVWGTDFPYLRSVESPGEEAASHYSDTITFGKSDFASALGDLRLYRLTVWN